MILVTGGLGYIGSVLVRHFMKKNIPVCLIDNGSRSISSPTALGAPYKIMNICRTNELAKFMEEQKVKTVVHLAGRMINEESLTDPESYYTHNLVGTVSVLNAMREVGIFEIIFASTSSVYKCQEHPLTETSEIDCMTPYARSKYFSEQIIEDYTKAYGIRAGILRFFNVSGAAYGIGEHHQPETCLIPCLLNSLTKSDSDFYIYGDQHRTPDGTCIRDFIHVEDLVHAIDRLIEYMGSLSKGSVSVFNLGSGRGYSVKEVVDAAMAVTGKTVRYKVASPRPGDPPILVSDYRLIQEKLNWKPRRNLFDIIHTQWRWLMTKVNQEDMR